MTKNKKTLFKKINWEFSFSDKCQKANFLLLYKHKFYYFLVKVLSICHPFYFNFGEFGNPSECINIFFCNLFNIFSKLAYSLFYKCIVFLKYILCNKDKLQLII